MRLNIKSRLFIWFISVSVIPLILIGGFSYYLIFDKISKQNEETIMNINNGIYNMVDTQQKVLSRWLYSSASALTTRIKILGGSSINYNKTVTLGSFNLPVLYIGNQPITNDHRFVDDLVEKEGLQATIFQFYDNKFIRISSSVRQSDGSRIEGTVLNSETIYNKLINGQTYLGRANVEGIWHATIYTPIYDNSNKIIGAFVLGQREQEYDLVNAIKKIVIGETGYVTIFDPSGNAIIHPTMQGQNLSSFPWVQEILEKKNGSIKYEFSGEKKIAYYTYYEPWNWYIVSTAYVSEVFNTTQRLSRLLFIAVFAVMGISLIIAYILSRAFSMPINNLMIAMREAQNGNLSTRFNYTKDDEFKVLSNVFNAMVNTISVMIGRISYNSTRLKESSKHLMLDIGSSTNSLSGIQDCAETIGNSKLQNDLEYELYPSKHMLNDIIDSLNQFKMDFSQVVVEKEYDKLEALIPKVSELESQLKNYNPFLVSIKNTTVPSSPQSINFANKIKSLEIEVEKLKLLLGNIGSSASSLDDIASALDKHINIFKIDNSDEINS